jgi:pimeloyl-ACP methyl ester carboxylesterase
MFSNRFKGFKGFTGSACAILLAASLFATTHAQQAATATASATLAAAPDQQFANGDVTIRYRDLGTGDPIVFIHGYTATLESMIGIANALPPDHRKIALDVRGFGRSSKFNSADKYGQKMVDDVVALMDHLKIQRAHLVGHSMGALISANVAARYPDRVSTAALVAGPFWGEPDITVESRRWTADLESGKGLLNFMLWLLPGTDPKMGAAMNAGILKANDLPSLTESMRELPKLSITSLPAHGSKVLLIAGTVDPLFPLSTAFAKKTPGSTMLEVQGANHVNVITHAEAVKAMTAKLQR